MHPNRIYFPVILDPPSHVSVISLKEIQRKRKEKKNSPICVAHILAGAWSDSQWPGL